MKALIGSKKFKAALAAALAAVAAGLTGAQSWEVAVMEIVGVAVAYIFAQGVADAGKEKAKIENGEE